MSRNWDEIEGFAGWAAVLRELLDTAAAAIQSDAIANRVEVQKELNQFIDNSPDAIAKPLDELARKAIGDLFLKTSEESLAAIASRSTELVTLTKTIKAITADAKKDVASIRLQIAKRVIDSLSETVVAANALRATLADAGADKDVAEAIDRTLKEAQKLWALVGALKPA